MTVAKCKNRKLRNIINKKIKKSMKGLFKFTTAALALLTMASCSSDDLFGNSESAQTPEKGALVVEVEELVDRVSTRAAFVPDGKNNSVFWQDKKDFIEVFDEAMLKYDIYQFVAKKGSFVNIDEDGVTRVSEPKFALFGGDKYAPGSSYITDFGWDYATDETTATFYLPSTFSVNEDITADKKTAFESFLPMWGEATKDGDNVKVNMHYLTAVLRVYLKNAHANITDFMVSAFEDQACTKSLPINGYCVATIADSEGPNADAQLEFTGSGSSQIIVNNINNVTGDAYLYIPLFAQKYGALKFWYKSGGTWKLIKTTKPMELKRQTVYRLDLESFEVAGDILESINAVLEAQKESTADVNITTQQTTNITPTDNVLKIPAGFKANINLDLAGLSLASNNLEIESEDGQYAGTLVINTKAAAIGGNNIYLNLPKANVAFVGDYSAINFGLPTTSDEDNDKLAVKSLTFSNGDNTTPTTIANNVYVDKESTDAITVDKDATVKSIVLQQGNETYANVSEIIINGTVTTIDADQDKNKAIVTVGKDGSVGSAFTANGDITIEGTAAAVTSNEGNITVGDKATVGGDITASKGKVTFTSENAYTNAISAKEVELGGKANVTTVTNAKNFTMKGQAKVGTVTIEKEGTAVIDVDAQDGNCEAISGTLTVNPDVEITLTQGYINKIDNTACTGEKPCKLNFGTGFTAVKTVQTWDVIPSVSEWNGKALPAAMIPTYFGSDVWTACQFASVDKATGNVRLMNNINLGDKAWTMPALTKNFAGVDMKDYKGLDLKESKYPTISNVKIQNKDAKGKDIDNAGLFSTVANKVEISNIIVKNAQVTLTGDKKNAGILAGSATGIIYVSNVNVEGSIETTAKFNNVGGLIGDAATPCIGWITTGTKDTKGVSVKLNKLQGQYNLGGFVGNISGTGWFNKCTLVDITGGITAVGAQNTFNVDKAGVKEAGSIGLIAGNVANDINIDACKAKDVIKGHKKELGFLADYIATIADPVKIYCYFGSGTDNNVGKIPAGKNLKLDGKTKTVPTLPVQCEKADDFKDHNNYVLHSKYADFDK